MPQAVMGSMMRRLAGVDLTSRLARAATSRAAQIGPARVAAWSSPAAAARSVDQEKRVRWAVRHSRSSRG